ncbi:MAG: TetR/AcrR family transcriptional regulator [Defluviitaleaceae bacterium]|nr:TetR/AcrR family transcriptional regulator [Defluviitaleaceae bacterium]MCL2837389.1 TetR/AcrR family transcriptional regulator [Defluviitaleaceae bacterium]
MPTTTFLNLNKEKRDRIVNAAIKEFGCRSLREANLANIIKDAKIPRGSLYQYFVSKDDLYIHIFEALRAERADYVKPAFQLYKKEPFLRFYEEFYLRDSEFLIMHPAHIELGKNLYSGNDNTSLGLIRQIQDRYKEWFVSAIEFDKERGVIKAAVHSSALADLCVHFVTDVFIFQSVMSQFTIGNIREHCKRMLYIIQNGIKV